MNHRMGLDAYDNHSYSSLDITGTRLRDLVGLKDKPMSQVLAQNMKRWHDSLSGSASTAIHKSYGAKSSYRSDEVDDKIPESLRDLVRDMSKRESGQRWDNLCNRLTAPSDEECTNWIAHHNPQRPKESRPTLKYVYPSNESTIEEAQDFGPEALARPRAGHHLAPAVSDSRCPVTLTVTVSCHSHCHPLS
jgi:hypothetical protein